MVLPLIIGAGAFITFGKELLGEKLFKVGILVIVSGVLYIGYKAYETLKAGEEIKDTIINKVILWVPKAKTETERILEGDPRYEDLEGVDKSLVAHGEFISQLFGGSAYTAGADAAQNTFNKFERKYDIQTAEKYAELSGIGRATVSSGDWITGGRATDLGRTVGDKLKKLFNK